MPESRLVEVVRAQGVRDPAVLAAVARVGRARFMPEALREFADVDRAFAIGEGQTISQPSLVARMTALLELAPGDRALEVGTGSGYQAALLACLAAEVHTVEILPSLAASAADRLRDLGFANVGVHLGDGHGGWPGRAPYAGIVVSCAAERIPPALVAQLAPGGRLVIPVGPQGLTQRLVRATKFADGRLETRDVCEVQFVPLTAPPML